MGKQAFEVVRISDGVVLRRGLHLAAAETLAHWWNHGLYDKGPYCEVRLQQASA